MTTSTKRPFSLAALASLLTLVAFPILGATTHAGAQSAPGAAAQPAPRLLSASPTTVQFPSTTLGDVSASIGVTLKNTGSTTASVTALTIGGTNASDFQLVGQDTCTALAAGASCVVQVTFAPNALGARQATLTPVDGSASPPVVVLSGTGSEGYYEATATGAVFAHGDAVQLGDMSGTPLTKPIVGIASTGDDGGYWLVASDGGIFSFGDATFYGSTGNIVLNKPIVGMAPYSNLDGQVTGYWLVASDGGIFSFGDAPFFGSTGNIVLNKPIVGMAPTPDGGGYWLVASDGGIFSFGDATFYGSTGGIVLNKPIVGMATTPDGTGYWLVASDGGIFTFGDAGYYGSTGNIVLNKPIVGMAPTPDGSGLLAGGLGRRHLQLRRRALRRELRRQRRRRPSSAWPETERRSSRVDRHRDRPPGGAQPLTADQPLGKSGQDDLVVDQRHGDGRALEVAAFRERQGQGILDLALEHPAQGSRPEVGVVAGVGQPRLGVGVHHQRQAALGQPTAQLVELHPDDHHEVGLA